MSAPSFSSGLLVAFGVAALAVVGTRAVRGSAPATIVSAAELDAAAAPGEAVAVLAGGCFWGIEAVFEHVKGVTSVASGYAGGTTKNPSYEDVSTGTTGHAEAVRITYDPAQVSFGTLLRVFFSVAHDPTQKDRQGPDVGTQYRSAIFYTSPEQKRVADAYVAQLEREKFFPRPIVTEVAPLGEFFMAEDYHQDYAVQHPRQPYIVIHDLPKVERLRTGLSELWREERVR